MNTNHILLASGTGFLGQNLSKFFTEKGGSVVVLTRRPRNLSGSTREVCWNGWSLGPWTRELEGAAAVINLAGQSVNCRYTARNRRELMESRLGPTRVLGEAIRKCQQPPRVWLNASTATLYRHTYGPAWDESGEIGAHPDAKDAFSIDLANAWEKAFELADTPSTRKVLLRSAMVLGWGANSVFPVLRRLAKLRLGGRMGHGRQWVSWIHETDFCRAVDWLLNHEDMAGAVNVAAPHPVPNAEMMRIMRDTCGVRIGLPAPAWLLELGAFFLRTETELIIKSRRVVPGRLQRAGFEFQFPDLPAAVEQLNRRGKV